MSAATPEFTVSDYLAQRLRELGVDHMFTVPGDYVTPFLDRVLAKKSLDVIPTPNEQIAGYAADGYARVRGIGAFAVTYGVGSFSALNAVAGSYVEHLPVVIVNGSPSVKNREQARLQGVLFHHSTGAFGADRDVYANVTTEARIVYDGDQAPAVIDAALVAAISRSRPVYIEVLKDVWDAPCARPAGTLARTTFFCDKRALAEAVEEAAGRLRRAKRSIVWADVLVARYHLTDAFEKFVRETGLSYTTSILGKSLLSEDTPGFVGTYDGPSADPETVREVEGADCILGLGVIVTDDYLNIINTDFSRMILAGASSVRIAYHTYDNVPLESFIPALHARLAPDGAVAKHRTPARVKAARAGAQDAITFEGFFFDRMQRFIGEDMVLIPDESNSMYVAGSLHVAAQHGFFSQAAWGSIGYATGGALGIGCAAPHKRAIVFAGDGGFQQIAQALAPMARLKQPAVVFLMNNDLYGIEQALIDLDYFDKGTPAPAYNVLDQWNYVELARAFGVQAEAVRTFGELDDLLERLKHTRATTFVRVVIPSRDLPWQIRALAAPPVPPPPAGARLAAPAARREGGPRLFALASIPGPDPADGDSG
jgi:indolepyruvate decarboxylase